MVLVLVVYVLAVARLTRLVNSDSVLDRVRVWVVRRFGPGSGSVYFLSCPWCVGFWVALLGAPAAVAVVGWPWWSGVPVALAASHLVGVFAFAADTEQVDITDEQVG